MTVTDIIDIDRAFDQRVLAAVPSTLALFAPQSLETHLRDMARQRRALCFTLMLPVRERGTTAMRLATALACLHVAPALASRGIEAIAEIMRRTAESDAAPVHEFCAPAAQTAPQHGEAHYREAIYAETDISIALTTCTPVELPAETLAAVEAVIQGAHIDIVTTIAITPWHPDLAESALRPSGPRPVLH
jgi:hypothetical protein